MGSGGKDKVKLIEIDGVCVYPCLHAWVFLLKQPGKLIKYTCKVTGKKNLICTHMVYLIECLVMMITEVKKENALGDRWLWVCLWEFLV